MSSRIESPWRNSPWLVLAATTLAAGLLAGSSGPLVLVALLGIAAVVLFFFRPELGMLAVAATVPVQNVVVFSGFTGTKILSAVVIVAWLANRLIWPRPWAPVLNTRFVILSAALIGMAMASVLWATESRVAYRGSIELLQLFVWALMIADLAKVPRVMTMLLRVLVLSGTLAAGLTLQQYLSGARRAGDMVGGGINATATMLVTLVPLAFYLLRAEAAFFWRLVGVVYVGMAVAAVPVTFSRMNLMLLVLVLLAMSALTFIGGRGRGYIAVLAGVAVVVGATLVPWSGIAERARTIGPYVQASLGQNAETPVSSGRGYHLRVGLAIAREHPFTGVGYRNYGYQFIRDYQFRVSGSEGLYYNPRSPHSSHFGMLADLGIFGLCVWIALLFVGGLHTAFRSWLGSLRKGLENTRFLAETLIVAVGLHAVPYAFYTPNDREKMLWILLAMTLALHHIATHSPRRGAVHPASERRAEPVGLPSASPAVPAA